MNVTLKRAGGFFVVRSDGVQSLGPSWPMGAVASVAKRKAATIYARDRAILSDGFGFDDALMQARDDVEQGKVKGAAVARCVGKFGDANLYERVFDIGGEGVEPISFCKVGEPCADAERARNTKTVHLQISKANTGRRIEGMASTPNIDRDQDIVNPEAFAEFMPKFMLNPVMLFNHDMNRPIGKVTSFQIRKEGLWVAGDVVDDQVWDWVSKDVLRTFSVSFVILDRKIVPYADVTNGSMTNVREITKAELLEVSIVTIPSNRQSVFSVAKSIANGTDLTCKTCDSCANGCECADSRAVVEHRKTAIAGSGPVDLRREALVEKAGRDGERQARLIDAEGALPLRHHGIQDGEIVLSPEALKVAAAVLVSYADQNSGRPLTEAERKAAWKHVAEHALECGLLLGEAPGRGPEPERVARLLGTSERGHWAIQFAAEMAAEAQTKWLREHGFNAPTPSGAEILESHWLDKGVVAALYRKAEREIPVLIAKSDADPKANVPPAATAAPTAAAGTPQPTPAASPAATKAPAAAAEADEIEIDSRTLAVLEAAQRGEPVDGDVLQAALNEVFEADSSGS